MYAMPLWKIHPKLSYNYKKMAEGFDTFAEFAKVKIDEAKEKIQNQNVDKDLDKDSMSVLNKLVAKCPKDSSFPFVAAFDMIFAGSDTTGTLVYT